MQVLAEPTVGLRCYAKRSAHQAELVDERQAEIDLQGLERAACRHTQDLGLDTIDAGIDPRRARIEQREQARQVRRLSGGLHSVLHRQLQRPAAPLVLDHPVEASPDSAGLPPPGPCKLPFPPPPPTPSVRTTDPT